MIYKNYMSIHYFSVINILAYVLSSFPFKAPIFLNSVDETSTFGQIFI